MGFERTEHEDPALQQTGLRLQFLVVSLGATIAYFFA